MKDAYFIYLGAEVEVCKQRISDRVAKQEYPADDYPVSDYIFEKYYHSDKGWDLPSIFRDVFQLNEKRLLMLNNNFSLEEALMQIEPFIDDIIKMEPVRFCAIQRQADHSEMSSPVIETEASSNSIEYSKSSTKLEEVFVPG